MGRHFPPKVKGNQVNQVLVETDDARLVIDGLKSNDDFSSFDLIVKDIKEITKHFGNIIFLFTKQSTNITSHLFARDIIFRPGRVKWNYVSFPSLFDVMLADNA